MSVEIGVTVTPGPSAICMQKLKKNFQAVLSTAGEDNANPDYAEEKEQKDRLIELAMGILGAAFLVIGQQPSSVGTNDKINAALLDLRQSLEAISLQFHSSSLNLGASAKSLLELLNGGDLSLPSCSSASQPAAATSTVESALRDIADQMEAIRAMGLVAATGLVRRRDPDAMERLPEIADAVIGG